MQSSLAHGDCLDSARAPSSLRRSRSNCLARVESPISWPWTSQEMAPPTSRISRCHELRVHPTSRPTGNRISTTLTEASPSPTWPADPDGGVYAAHPDSKQAIRYVGGRAVRHVGGISGPPGAAGPHALAAEPGGLLWFLWGNRCTTQTHLLRRPTGRPGPTIELGEAGSATALRLRDDGTFLVAGEDSVRHVARDGTRLAHWTRPPSLSPLADLAPDARYVVAADCSNRSSTGCVQVFGPAPVTWRAALPCRSLALGLAHGRGRGTRSS